MKAEEGAGGVAKGDTARLSAGGIDRMSREVPEWTLREGAIEREFSLSDFRGAIEFVNRVAALAEEEDHHPDIFVFYNRVRLVLSTHKAGGLSRKDFLLAVRIDNMAAQKI
jgi:4a-hydroxytetrahydrobiopterin dehydratase